MRSLGDHRKPQPTVNSSFEIKVLAQVGLGQGTSSGLNRTLIDIILL
jgi:hypothetical protein